MIESISIASAATFGNPPNPPEVLASLSKINFVYGSNGTGKTTISRIIADEIAYPSCKVHWKNRIPLQPMVYNHDFIEKNFNQVPELKGVFTLGVKNIETLEKITAAKDTCDSLAQKIGDLTTKLAGDDGKGGKQKELTDLENELRETCWKQKQKHDPKLQNAFKGYRDSSEKFKEKILHESRSNVAVLAILADLEKTAETVFGVTPTIEHRVSSVEFEQVLAHESATILKKRVLGKADVDISAMINKLGNCDWVRTGIPFYKKNEMVCPFCQQDTTEALSQSLENYFDETFETDTSTIEILITSFRADTEKVQNQIEALLSAPSRFLDLEKLKSEKELFDSKTVINLQRLAEKKKEPSQIIALESVDTVAKEISVLINVANSKVQAHNKLIDNLAAERSTLTAQVWKYLLAIELKSELDSYKTKRESLGKAITAITEQIKNAHTEIRVKQAEIRELEKTTTTIQPTIDEINSLLLSFGFQGFSLTQAVNGASYKLSRTDGSDAKTTLSEGEKSFVTFLYFYHLLKGSNSESGITKNRVVVFDDPVSSLDSDILFVVSSLIKEILNEVREGTGQIKQVFILTHNVYFHKEITYHSKRNSGKSMNCETFWVVQKSAMNSKVCKHETNPIKTSYDLLWAEVRNQDRSSLTIQNTLRRILENYFRIIGGTDPDRICTNFEGKEKLICKSLFSWINDGSHSTGDDLFHTIDNSTVDVYMEVFRAIFEREGHLGHYKMMMGNTHVETESAVNEGTS